MVTTSVHIGAVSRWPLTRPSSDHTGSLMWPFLQITKSNIVIISTNNIISRALRALNFLSRHFAEKNCLFCGFRRHLHYINGTAEDCKDSFDNILNTKMKENDISQYPKTASSAVSKDIYINGKANKGLTWQYPQYTKWTSMAKPRSASKDKKLS